MAGEQEADHAAQVRDVEEGNITSLGELAVNEVGKASKFALYIDT